MNNRLTNTPPCEHSPRYTCTLFMHKIIVLTLWSVPLNFVAERSSSSHMVIQYCMDVGHGCMCMIHSCQWVVGLWVVDRRVRRHLLMKPITKLRTTNTVHMYCNLFIHVIIPLHSSKTANLTSRIAPSFKVNNVVFILYVPNLLVL